MPVTLSDQVSSLFKLSDKVVLFIVAVVAERGAFDSLFPLLQGRRHLELGLDELERLRAVDVVGCQVLQLGEPDWKQMCVQPTMGNMQNIVNGKTLLVIITAEALPILLRGKGRREHGRLICQSFGSVKNQQGASLNYYILLPK